jgi:hypothetical protein
MKRYYRAIIAGAALAALTTSAFAHSWYSQRRDPIYSQTTCCGGSDCRELPAHAISITPDGQLRVTLTVEEARKINPVRRYGFDKIISFDRIQTSEDGTPHICLMAHDAPEDPREGYYCIFLPPTG